jgi:hypothetical protein
MNVERDLGGSIERHYTVGGLRARMRLPWDAETLELGARSGGC